MSSPASHYASRCHAQCHPCCCSRNLARHWLFHSGQCRFVPVHVVCVLEGTLRPVYSRLPQLPTRLPGVYPLLCHSSLDVGRRSPHLDAVALHRHHTLDVHVVVPEDGGLRGDLPGRVEDDDVARHWLPVITRPYAGGECAGPGVVSLTACARRHTPVGDASFAQVSANRATCPK